MMNSQSEKENSVNAADASELSLQEREDIVELLFQRWRADMLCFPYLCIKTACRRARTCSADPGICMGHLVPFVPYEALNGVDALLEGNLDGLTYDEVCARAPQEVGAYEGWLECVNQCQRNRAQARTHPKPES